jgi:hypothetical protein
MMIIDTLTKRRNEIAAQIRELQQSITHIDATIKLFSPEYKIRRPRREGITRAIFDVLRDADKPLTTGEVSAIIGQDSKRVGIALAAQKKKGLVTGKRDGVYSFWEIEHHP